jgi:hypothetical protein
MTAWWRTIILLRTEAIAALTIGIDSTTETLHVVWYDR